MWLKNTAVQNHSVYREQSYIKSPKDITVTYSSITDIHNEASES